MYEKRSKFCYGLESFFFYICIEIVFLYEYLLEILCFVI